MPRRLKDFSNNTPCLTLTDTIALSLIHVKHHIRGKVNSATTFSLVAGVAAGGAILIQTENLVLASLVASLLIYYGLIVMHIALRSN